MDANSLLGVHTGPARRGRSARRIYAHHDYLDAPALNIASKPELYNVRTVKCPTCGGTELSSAGGGSHYYYRCKKCDPEKSGKPMPEFASARGLVLGEALD